MRELRDVVQSDALCGIGRARRQCAVDQVVWIHGLTAYFELEVELYGLCGRREGGHHDGR